ncbi:MAG: hypothetical protein WC197_09215 [Candidatus Gastranaerophilaceae bacterium]|jgi:hypothetical protein
MKLFNKFKLAAICRTFLLLAFVLLTLANVFAQENIQVNVYYSFKAVVPDSYPLKYSDNQFPNFKENDLLIVDKIVIVNDSKFDLNNLKLKMNLVTPYRTIKNPFLIEYLNLPDLNKNSELNIHFDKMTKEVSDDKVIFFLLHYSDDLNNSYNLWPTRLLDVGYYAIDSNLILEHPPASSYSFGSAYLNNGWAYPNDFKVVSEGTVKELGYSDLNLKGSIVNLGLTVLILIITVLTSLLPLQKDYFKTTIIFKLLKFEIEQNKKMLLSQKRKFKLQTVFLKAAAKVISNKDPVISSLVQTLFVVEQFNLTETKDKLHKEVVLENYRQLETVLEKEKVGPSINFGHLLTIAVIILLIGVMLYSCITLVSALTNYSIDIAKILG